MTEKQRKNRHGVGGKAWIADLCLILFLALVGLFLWLFLRVGRTPGAVARVTIGNKVIAEYPLDKDGRFVLANGGNILVIEGGEAYIESADCPDKICVKTGKISHVGERVVCLPHRLSVEIVGDENGADFVKGG